MLAPSPAAERARSNRAARDARVAASERALVAALDDPTASRALRLELALEVGRSLYAALRASVTAAALGVGGPARPRDEILSQLRVVCGADFRARIGFPPGDALDLDSAAAAAAMEGLAAQVGRFLYTEGDFVTRIIDGAATRTSWHATRPASLHDLIERQLHSSGRSPRSQARTGAPLLRTSERVRPPRPPPAPRTPQQGAKGRPTSRSGSPGKKGHRPVRWLAPPPLVPHPPPPPAAADSAAEASSSAAAEATGNPTADATGAAADPVAAKPPGARAADSAAAHQLRLLASRQAAPRPPPRRIKRFMHMRYFPPNSEFAIAGRVLLRFLRYSIVKQRGRRTLVEMRRELAACQLLQRCGRGCNGRGWMWRLRVRVHAASRIQCFVRCWRARASMRRRRVEAASACTAAESQLTAFELVLSCAARRFIATRRRGRRADAIVADTVWRMELENSGPAEIAAVFWRHKTLRSKLCGRWKIKDTTTRVVTVPEPVIDLAEVARVEAATRARRDAAATRIAAWYRGQLARAQFPRELWSLQGALRDFRDAHRLHCIFDARRWHRAARGDGVGDAPIVAETLRRARMRQNVSL